VAGLAVVALFPSAAHATVFTVSGAGDDTGAQPCPANACPTLRDAIAAAGASGDTIKLGAGTFTINDQLLITDKSLTIAGAGRDSTTVTQSASCKRVLEIEESAAGATVVLSGLTISRGCVKGTDGADGPGMTGASGGDGGDAKGGGIADGLTAKGAALTLDHVSLTGNRALGGKGGDGGPGAAPILGAGGNGGAGGKGGRAEGGAVWVNGPLTMTGGVLLFDSATGGAGGVGGAAGAGTLGFAYGSAGVPGPGGAAGGGAIHVAGGATSPLSSTATMFVQDVATGGAGGTGGSGGPLSSTGPNTPGGVGGAAYGGAIDATAGVTLDSSTIAGAVATGGIGGAGAPAAGSAVGSASGGHGGDAAGGGIEDTLAAAGLSLGAVNTTFYANAATGGSGGVAGGAPGAVAGAPGAGIGGALSAGTAAIAGTVKLASDTLAGNQGSTDAGDLVLAGSTLQARGTIFSAGKAGVANCNLTGGQVGAEDHNLDEVAPSKCGLSAPSDIVGKQAGVLKLNNYGGPTVTAAIAPTSPAFGTGGACADLAGAPLTVDQRGVPRTAACDIGAFQHQPTANSAPPQVQGLTRVGDVAFCTQGTWTGDGSFSYAYQWLRDGTTIAGATKSSYTVVTGDVGKQLSCRVTATALYGSATATSAAATGSLRPGGSKKVTPKITGLSQSARVWREGGKGTKPPIGTTFGFSLNVAARLELDFTQSLPGRRVRGKCVAPTARNRRGPRCTRTVTAGRLLLPGRAGRDIVHFDGRLPGSAPLPPGRYTLVVIATAGGRRSRPSSIAFTIVKR
jgi:hypothetical protein